MPRGTLATDALSDTAVISKLFCPNTSHHLDAWASGTKRSPGRTVASDPREMESRSRFFCRTTASTGKLERNMAANTFFSLARP